MRKALMLFAMAGMFLGTLCLAQQELTPKQMLRQQQKQEMKNLKLKEKFQKQMFKNEDMSRALRTEMKHDLKREERDIKRRQKEERQSAKDRQRVMTEGLKQLSSD